jgi:hypothetical protein
MQTIHHRIAAHAAFLTSLFAASTLVAGAALAAEPPLSCTTNRGTWNVVASAPRIVECPAGGECTQIDYTITKATLPSLSARTFTTSNKPDYVAVLAEQDMTIVIPSTTYVQPPCKGDPITELGERDCSSRSVRVPRTEPSGFYELAVEGGRAPITASIAIKKGASIEQCRIASLGRDAFDPNAQVSSAQQYVFKGCTVTIPTDPTTGEGGPASLIGDGCVFVANAEPVTTGELIINGTSVGALSYGEGSVSSGVASCTTRVINRKLYSWCTCADVNGDGIPDDPRPPCPNTVGGASSRSDR